MKQLKKVLSSVLALAMIVSTLSAPAFAAGEGSTTYKDGTYQGTATVESDGFNYDAYDIKISVTVESGKITSVKLADDCTIEDVTNKDYVLDALEGNRRSTGIEAQIKEAQNAANIDVVAGATYSSRAVITAAKSALNKAVDTSTGDTGDSGDSGDKTENETTVSLASDTVAYNTKGSSFEIAVTNPKSDADYTDITITYSMGRESGTLEKGTDYSVAWDGSKATVTILSTGSYNKLGQSLTVSFAGAELGTVAIKSSATVAIENNALKLTGGNGETLADYMAQITKITVDGTEYPTVEQRNVHTVYEVSDFFNSNGSVNFGSDKFANGVNGTYVITVEANGFTGVTGSAGGQSEPSASANKITVPEGLADGNYQATAKVDPDDATDGSESFNFYPITVTVTVKDGKITNIAVSGATGNNIQYSYRAETGIGEQISGKGAGDYEVDVVGMATCSSVAIIEAVNAALQGEPVGSTTLTLGDAIYYPDGTPFTVTVTDPEEGVDYSDIALSYAVGKFADTLTKDTDYTVELVSESESELVYKVTVLNTEYTIEDDSASGTEPYNQLGRNLDVTVAGTSAGRIVITSSAKVAIENNTLKLTGGNGETVADYLETVGTIAISYTDENGKVVENSYTTKMAHDVAPTYYATDIFDEVTGAVNFVCEAFVYGADGIYTITAEAEGFDTITATVGSKSGPVASANKITVPEGLADGNYAATVRVDPDDATDGTEGFDFYPITVTVTVKDGKIASIAVSGATGNNTQYSYRAETGIGQQITGKGAGDYDVDVVSMATCSSVAISEAINTALQGEPVGNTAFVVGDAIYEPEGTPFTVTVTNPEEGVDYSQITLSYAAGKFSEALTEDGYKVELESESDSELVYKVTVLNTLYIIDDDSNSKWEPYNELGRQLDVTVAGTSAGRIVIMSSAKVAIENNTLTLTGGNGETVTDYLEAVEAITISYTDENGETVENRYAAKVEHDVPVEYYPTDIFDEETGEVNFACGAFVYGEDIDYTITIETMNDCFSDLTGIVGALAVAPEQPSEPEQPVDPEQPSEPEQPVDPEQPSEPEQPADSEQPSNIQKPSGTQQSGNTQKTSGTQRSGSGKKTGSNSNKTASSAKKTSSVNTGDESHILVWLSVLILSCAFFATLVVKKGKKQS